MALWLSGSRNARNSHFSKTAIKDVIADWKVSRNVVKVFHIAIFLGFQKAFETIDRNILIKKKLRMYNIEGEALKRFKSYLERWSPKYTKSTKTDLENSQMI